LCHSFALESALALRRPFEIPSQATNLDDRKCSAGRRRFVPVRLKSWHFLSLHEMEGNHSAWANAFSCCSD
jgi:hypothetical protein